VEEKQRGKLLLKGSIMCTLFVKGLEEEANMLFLTAEDALNRTADTEEIVTEIEEDLEGVADSIRQTQSNIQEASDALNLAENKC
jgi:hypothetical protein